MNYGYDNFEISIPLINIYEALGSVGHNTKSGPDFLFSISFQKYHNALARPVYFLFKTEKNIFLKCLYILIILLQSVDLIFTESNAFIIA